VELSDCWRHTLKASTRRGLEQIHIRYDIETDPESTRPLAREGQEEREAADSSRLREPRWATTGLAH